MTFNTIPLGDDVPHAFSVVIEISAYAHPVKYEVNKDTGAIHVDRFIATRMSYPCNYGYLPNTHSEDGDPLDALVITPFPLMTGCVIEVRPVGLLKMEDEAGIDAKILTVPTNKLSNHYAAIQEPTDFLKAELDPIVHFFEHYKDLESGKWVKLQGWGSSEEAKNMVLKSLKK